MVRTVETGLCVLRERESREIWYHQSKPTTYLKFISHGHVLMVGAGDGLARLVGIQNDARSAVGLDVDQDAVWSNT